jgi:hypothetical protein
MVMRYLALNLEGRNRTRYSPVINLEGTNYEPISMKDFRIFQSVLRSLIDSSYIRLVCPVLENSVGVENEKYYLKCFYRDFEHFNWRLQELILKKIVFREAEDDTLILALELLLESEWVEFGRVDCKWVKTFKRVEKTSEE